MMNLSDYKNALGKPTDNVSEKDLQKIMETQDALAEIFYVMWSDKKNKKAIIEKQCQELMEKKTELFTVV